MDSTASYGHQFCLHFFSNLLAPIGLEDDMADVVEWHHT